MLEGYGVDSVAVYQAAILANGQPIRFSAVVLTGFQWLLSSDEARVLTDIERAGRR
jgi:hypothetical protein